MKHKISRIFLDQHMKPLRHKRIDDRKRNMYFFQEKQVLFSNKQHKWITIEEKNISIICYCMLYLFSEDQNNRSTEL